MRISDWSSDVCSSDLNRIGLIGERFCPFPFAQCEERESHQRTLAAHLGQQRTVEREKIDLDRTGVIHGRAAPVRRRSVGESMKMGCGIVRIPPIASPQAAKFVLSKTVCSARRVPSCFRSDEHTSELQSLMRISYAVFCLKKNKHTKEHYKTQQL